MDRTDWPGDIMMAWLPDGWVVGTDDERWFPMYTILIVEDDVSIATILQEHLQRYGYRALCARDFQDLRREFLDVKPDLVLLDINLPYYDGFYWCRQIRAVSHVPIIYLSARSDEMNQVLAIECGGDDYITKPFHLEVLLAKVKGVLRRAYGEYAGSRPLSDVQELAGLYIHRDRQEISWKDRKVPLTPKECRLLDCLIRQAESVVTREELLEALWDETDFVDDNTLTVNVTRLRKKLAELGIADAIETVRGQGYRLRVTWQGEA
mgnify:FL=1